MAKFYDPLTQRWHEMVSAPVIERTKRPTEEQLHADRIVQNFRLAQHKHVWDAIESTATATQMNGTEQEHDDE